MQEEEKLGELILDTISGQPIVVAVHRLFTVRSD
jgi:hypothetical protein